MPTAAQRAALAARFSGLGQTAVVWHGTPPGKVWGPGARATLGGNANERADSEAQRAARRRFVDWLSKAYPGLVESLTAALSNGPPTVRGLGQTNETQEQSLIDRIMGAAETILPAYLQYEQQKEVLDVQLERARAGLPPLEVGNYAPSVQVGLDQQTIDRIMSEAASRAGQGVQMAGPWLIGLLALGAFLLLGRR